MKQIANFKTKQRHQTNTNNIHPVDFSLRLFLKASLSLASSGRVWKQLLYTASKIKSMNGLLT